MNTKLRDEQWLKIEDFLQTEVKVYNLSTRQNPKKAFQDVRFTVSIRNGIGNIIKS